MPEEIGSPERHLPPLVPYTAASQFLRSSEWRGGAAVKWQQRTMAEGTV